MTELEELEEVEKYLEDVRKEFANEPDLLAFYEPSALYLVECYRQELKRNGMSNDC